MIKLSENNYNLNQFITKDNFSSLTSCVALVITITEMFKLLFTGIEPRILVIIFSFIVSFTKMYFEQEDTDLDIKKQILIALYNVVPIAIGSIGAYDMIIKVISKSFGVE